MEQVELVGQVQTAPEESAILKQVHATHTPHGCQVNVDLIINITEQILIQVIARSNVNIGVDHEKSERLDTSMKAAGFAELDAQDTLMIHKLSRELSCSKVSGGVQAHAKTMQLLNTLSSYTWVAKVALVLSGFAVNFGEFWLAVEPPTHTLSQSLALLRKFPNIGQKSSTWKHQFDILNKLVKTALDVTKCILEVKNLPSDYISEDAPLKIVVNAHIPQDVYWTILSIVTCSSEIGSALRWRNEYISSNEKAWELSNLLSNLTNIHEELKDYVDICYKYIVQKILHQSWTYSNENLQTNMAASNKAMVSTRVNIQRRKHMLLLISDLDISEEEIEVLGYFYKDQKMRSELYEMIWVPILDRSIGNDSNQHKFDELKSKTSWYNFHNPVIDPALIKQIKEQWKFRKQPIVVVLNQQDEVSSTNAIHLMRIWGNSAFSFTAQIEKDLWSSWNWSIVRIIDRVDAVIPEWMKQKENICLYGGVDLEWIRKFTKKATSLAREYNIDVKMAYMGKSNARKEMQEMITIFGKEKLSYFLPDLTSIWVFWAQLESIVHSRSHHGMTDEDNVFMSLVNTLLTYDGREKGWAIFFGESNTYDLAIWLWLNETPLLDSATAQNFVPKFSYCKYYLET